MKITKPQALRAMKDAVAEKGEDFVYRTDPYDECVYTQEGQPSCLVGHALYRLGVPIETLIALDTENFGDTDIATVAETTLSEQGVQITAPALNAFISAQQAQDCYETWGTALKNAEDLG